MDRWYDAEDGNIWISFQSADRNKVDEETYLVLKNKHGSETPVEEEARYKILAIKNEAPDFIKTDEKIVGEAELNQDTYNLSTTAVISFDGIESEYDAFDDYTFEGVGYARVLGTVGDVTRKSDWVRISRLNDVAKEIVLVEEFGTTAAMNTVYGFGAGSSPFMQIEVKDTVKANKPEFEGRFFVKINKFFYCSS